MEWETMTDEDGNEWDVCDADGWDDDGQPDEHTEWQDVFGGDDFAEQWECDFGGEW